MSKINTGTLVKDPETGLPMWDNTMLTPVEVLVPVPEKAWREGEIIGVPPGQASFLIERKVARLWEGAKIGLKAVSLDGPPTPARERAKELGLPVPEKGA